MPKVSETDKVRILEMYAQGLTTQEIKKAFHGKYRQQQFAAIKAWKTMGKYPVASAVASVGREKANIFQLLEGIESSAKEIRSLIGG